MSFLILLFSIQILSIIFNLLRVISKKLMISLLRYSYAIFLLFSGFVKLIDPLGFSYKLQEYFEVFGLDFLIPFSLFLSIFVILFEMFLGICLILGIYVKKIVWGNLMLMLFFTFLTFFSAYFNKVTDCGCFGDFMKLDPWTSFTKDIYLLIISFLLLIYQAYITPLTKSIKTNNSVLLVSLLVLLFIPIHALSFLPFIDFRPYKIGVDIIQEFLTYAEKKCPNNYKFILNNSLSIPLSGFQFDFVVGFSIFTHLFQAEIMIYSEQIFNLLKPGGTFLYSFLELEHHWETFEKTYNDHKEYSRPYPHLKMFLDRNQIATIADKCGFILEKFVEPKALGQSVVILKKPK